MSDDYQDCLNEPTAADELIEEMKDKLHNLIKDEAKEIMLAYQRAKTELRDLSVEINRKQRRITDLQREIKEFEEECKNIDKYKMPRKYIDSFVKDYTGNFVPGDKVFVIDWNHKRVTCDKCKGKKQLDAVVDGEEIKIKCMKCNGYGEISEPIATIKESRIDTVYLKLGFAKDFVNVWSSDCVTVAGREYTTNPTEIFRSYEEAKKSLEEE